MRSTYATGLRVISTLTLPSPVEDENKNHM